MALSLDTITPFLESSIAPADKTTANTAGRATGTDPKKEN